MRDYQYEPSAENVSRGREAKKRYTGYKIYNIPVKFELIKGHCTLSLV